MKTTKSNLEARQEHISLSELPQNFKDAVEVTLDLGLRYLWIDALCILQDDLADWEVESREMANIYGGAHVIIGADGAEDAEKGFLCDSHEFNANHSETKAVLVAVIDDEAADVFAFECPKHDIICSVLYRDVPSETYNVMENPISQRAWTFQVQLLARRMIHFTKEEIIWGCKSHFRCECTQLDGAHQRVLTDDWISGNIVDMVAQWYLFVNEVCTRNITVKSDLLPCLSGLAAQMDATLVGTNRYLAGLWEEDLLMGLTWSHEKPQRRVVPRQAPTWSWASLEGKSPPYRFLRRQWRSMAMKAPHAQIIDAQCVPSGQNAYGSVSHGHIKSLPHLSALKSQNIRTTETRETDSTGK